MPRTPRLLVGPDSSSALNRLCRARRVSPLHGQSRPRSGWTVAIAHLDGPHPDFSPASSDAEQTWALLDKLTSSPAPAPYATAVNGTISTTAALHGWDELLADPPADLAPAAHAHLEQLAELEAAWPALAHDPGPRSHAPPRHDYRDWVA